MGILVLRVQKLLCLFLGCPPRISLAQRTLYRHFTTVAGCLSCGKLYPRSSILHGIIHLSTISGLHSQLPSHIRSFFDFVKLSVHVAVFKPVWHTCKSAPRSTVQLSSNCFSGLGNRNLWHRLLSGQCSFPDSSTLSHDLVVCWKSLVQECRSELQ